MPPRTPLLSPEAYFDRRSNPLPAGLGVFVVHVVGTVVAVYAAASLLLSRIENAPPALERALYDVLGTVVLVSLVVAVVALLVVASVMHHLVDGDGTFGDAIAVAGWGYAPETLAIPVNHVLVRREIGRLSFDGSDPAVLQTQLEAAQDSSGVGWTVIVLLTVAWSVYILANGTAGTHDVDVGDAIGPALLVGLGSLVLNLVFG